MTKINKNEYVDIALKSASIIVEDGVYCGVVEAMPGVWAQGDSKSECLKILAECAQSWIESREIEGLSIPPLEFQLNAANQ